MRVAALLDAKHRGLFEHRSPSTHYFGLLLYGGTVANTRLSADQAGAAKLLFAN
jgi:hypothetical protein